MKSRVSPRLMSGISIVISALLVAMMGQAAATSAPQVSLRGLQAVQLYSEDELVQLIRDNQHFKRVRDTDDCQLYQDIRAQAEIERRPVYQLLYGDMLAYAVCYERNVQLGVEYMRHAAAQGMPEAIEQMGRYYHRGLFVQQNTERAILYLREAAALGSVSAQIQFADILLDGNGSPRDYEAAYHYLHNAVVHDRHQHAAIAGRLEKLAERMPPRVVERARSPLDA